MQSQNLVLLLSHLSAKIIIIDLCYDNRCIKMTIELILTIQINFDTTHKKMISTHWWFAIGEQTCTYIFLANIVNEHCFWIGKGSYYLRRIILTIYTKPVYCGCKDTCGVR